MTTSRKHRRKQETRPNFCSVASDVHSVTSGPRELSRGRRLDPQRPPVTPAWGSWLPGAPPPLASLPRPACDSWR